MGIYCRHCSRHHNITPLSHGETELMRAKLLGDTSKSYFCDLLCYYRHTNVYHPDGYRAMSKVNVVADWDLQQSHPTWKLVPWLKKAFEQSVHAVSRGQLITLDTEENLTKMNMEQARLEQLAREQGEDNVEQQDETDD